MICNFTVKQCEIHVLFFASKILKNNKGENYYIMYGKKYKIVKVLIFLIYQYILKEKKKQIWKFTYIGSCKFKRILLNCTST